MTESEIERARSVPHHSTAEVAVAGASSYDATYYGAFVATLTGGDAAFTIAAFDAVGRSINGTLSVSAEDLHAFTERGFIVSRANSEFEWVYENRGTVYLQGDESGEITAQIRDVELRTAEDGLFAVVLVVVPHQDIDTSSRTVAVGNEIQISIAGRLLASCFQVDENGTVLADPTSSSAECEALEEMTGE